MRVSSIEDLIGKLRETLSKIPTVDVGDIIQPEHHNLQTDALILLADIIDQLVSQLVAQPALSDDVDYTTYELVASTDWMAVYTVNPFYPYIVKDKGYLGFQEYYEPYACHIFEFDAVDKTLTEILTMDYVWPPSRVIETSITGRYTVVWNYNTRCDEVYLSGKLLLRLPISTTGETSITLDGKYVFHRDVKWESGNAYTRLYVYEGRV